MESKQVKEQENWQVEKARLLYTIKKYERSSVRLTKRFKLLQQTLIEQQQMLDRYQTALNMRRIPVQEKSEHETNKKKCFSPGVDGSERLKVAYEHQASVLDCERWTPREVNFLKNKPIIKATELLCKPSIKGDVSQTQNTKILVETLHKPVYDEDNVENKNELVGADVRFPSTVTSSTTNHKRTWNEVKKGEQPQQVINTNKENDFPYVEVVRNRDERAALPAYDCVECSKYYKALDGLLTSSQIEHEKSKCSRHRARFEPYNTPDDFWRLSFPDSHP